jgi:NAD(P)-dependent dehydrogenase (short-subunit alcohol dehydrogenase family)
MSWDHAPSTLAPMPPLAGKKILIIGGSSGIGFGVAKAALAEGAHVIIASSSATKLEAATERLGGGERVQNHVVDVSSEESFEALFDKIGKVDHLVYTVSVCMRKATVCLTKQHRPEAEPIWARFRSSRAL